MTEKLPFVYVTYVESSPERIWQTLTDADATARYWGHSNVSDWQVGSRWEHQRTDGTRTADVIGMVLDSSPPTRLVTTWARPSKERANDPSRVSFDVEPYGQIVRLTVTHAGLADQAEWDAAAAGWAAVLSNLKTFVETGNVLAEPPWEMPQRREPPADASAGAMPTWTATAAERTEPERTTGERAALEQWLDYQRATLLTKCAGLTAEQLKTRAVPPSGLSLLGLVRHMTEVERWWFRMHANGEDIGFPYDPNGEGADFDDLADADAAACLDMFHREIDAAGAAVRDKPLDHVVPSRGDHPERTRNVRWIYLHMIEEYARHNGHADLLRERLDGVTGD